MFSNRSLRVALYCAVLLAAQTACADGPEDSETVAAAAPTEECVSSGYPCTWSEVDSAVVVRTFALGRLGARLLSAGASTAVLADSLSSNPEVTDLSWDDRSVRFRLEQGQFITVVDGSAFEAGFRSLPSRFPQQQPRHTPVGKPGPGKPLKKALILTAFEWEFGRQEARDLVGALSTTKDYCPDGRPPCGDYIRRNHRTNYWAYAASPGPASTGTPTSSSPYARSPSGIRIVDRQVNYEDFQGWEAFDLIHVSTHGLVHCWDDRSGDCPHDLNLLATGPYFMENGPWHPVGFVGTDPVFELRETGLYLSTVTARGVEFLFRSDPDACSLAGSSPSPTDPLGDNNVTYGEMLCGQDPILEVVTNVFFESEYPKGLSDTFVFLNGCEMLTIPRLSDHLKKGGNTTVLGWARSPPNTHAVTVSQEFYRYYLGRSALKAKSSYDKVLAEAQRTGPTSRVSTSQIANFFIRGLAATGSPLLQTDGEDDTRGRELVAIIDPRTGHELQDGGTLPLVGSPGDGRPDQVEISLEVSGIDDDEDPTGYPMRLRFDDRTIGQTLTADTRVADGTWTYRGTVDLGFDASPGPVEEIEIRTDMPDGGFSRWIYENIDLSGCFWRASISGSGTNRAVTASWGHASTSHEANVIAWRTMVPNTVVLDGDPQPQAPWTIVDLEPAGVFRLSEAGDYAGFRLAIPGLDVGQTGTYNRVWGSLGLGQQNHFGNADYLRRDLAGLPEGSGIGHVLTTNVTLTRNDSVRVEGTFEGRFLDRERFQQLDIYEQHPLGVGIHAITGAEITAEGEFSMLRDGSCRMRTGGLRRPRG